MTATNHALSGALAAMVVKEPAIAVVVAFLLHFVMDAIPHFGFSYSNVLARNKDKRFKTILLADVAVSAILLVIVPVMLDGLLPIWLTLLCMLACMSPDLVWGWHYYHEIAHKVERPKAWFSKFHKWIQWSESPPGLIAEVLWFTAIGSLIILKV
jgi:hypothetical protein